MQCFKGTIFFINNMLGVNKKQNNKLYQSRSEHLIYLLNFLATEKIRFRKIQNFRIFYVDL